MEEVEAVEEGERGDKRVRTEEKELEEQEKTEGKNLKRRRRLEPDREQTQGKEKRKEKPSFTRAGPGNCEAHLEGMNEERRGEK